MHVPSMREITEVKVGFKTEVKIRERKISNVHGTSTLKYFPLDIIKPENES